MRRSRTCEPSHEAIVLFTLAQPERVRTPRSKSEIFRMTVRTPLACSLPLREADAPRRGVLADASPAPTPARVPEVRAQGISHRREPPHVSRGLGLSPRSHRTSESSPLCWKFAALSHGANKFA